jgi:hypothetical protein
MTFSTEQSLFVLTIMVCILTVCALSYLASKDAARADRAEEKLRAQVDLLNTVTADIFQALADAERLHAQAKRLHVEQKANRLEAIPQQEKI